MLINLPIHILKILAKRPVLDQLGPVKTKTGLKTEKDRGLRSFSVRSGLFQFWDEGRLVSVSVQALRAKKPDRTGLSSTTHRRAQNDMETAYTLHAALFVLPLCIRVRHVRCSSRHSSPIMHISIVCYISKY